MKRFFFFFVNIDSFLTKVMRHEATELETKLIGKWFKSWAEKFEVMKVGKIRIEDIDTFLDNIQKSNEGKTYLIAFVTMAMIYCLLTKQ